MLVHRKEFVSKLEEVFPAIGGGFIPEYDCFHFRDKLVQATDGMIKISAELENNTDLDCCVPAEPLLRLLKSLDDDEVEISCNGKELLVKAGKVQGLIMIRGKAAIDVFSLPKIEPVECYDDLVTGLSLCSIVTSKDSAAGSLGGVLVNESELFGTDAYRLARWPLKYKLDGVKCIIPSKFIKIISSKKDRIVEIGYSSDASTLSATFDNGTKVVSGTLTGRYPDVTRCFPSSECEYVELDISEALSGVLDRHISFLKELKNIWKFLLCQFLQSYCWFIGRKI